MPGANYMGGKRNAARARIKDTDGKAQRSHFGKKRFEVLRTGLSKGGAARDVPRELPEISLAHARRRRAQDGLEDEHEWERNWPGLRSPSTSPVLHLRSPPVNTAPGRSKVLTMLDEDDPSVRRAQVQKILQTPDLLGLSKIKGRARSHKASTGELQTSCEPIQRQRSPDNRHVSLESPSIEGSPSSTMDPDHHQRTPSYRSRSRERTLKSSPARSSHLSSHRAESVFVPMFLDSSPPSYVDDSGYAEFWPDPHPDYEPTRVPFYAQSSHINQRHSVVSMSEGATSPSPTHLSRSGNLAALSCAPSRVSSRRSASPSLLELPSPHFAARFVSHLPSPRSSPPVEPWQLSPSSTSRFSWSELASLSFLGSPNVPQASFSPSPPHFTGSSDVEEGVLYDGYRSDGPSQGSSVDDAPEDVARPSVEEHAVQWDYVYLEDVLGDLDADPWTALGKLLGLPSSPVGTSDSTEKFLVALDTSDRRGVGYTVPSSAPSSTSLSTSQTLGNAFLVDSTSLDSSSVVSPTGLRLDGGHGDRYAGHEADQAEAEFVGSPVAEAIFPQGSYAPPRCSAGLWSPPQPSVMSLAHRPETRTQTNQTAESLKTPRDGEDLPSEAVHIGDRRSPFVAYHSKRDDNLGLVDGPSLFDDDDLWCSEE